MTEPQTVGLLEGSYSTDFAMLGVRQEYARGEIGPTATVVVTRGV